MKLNQAPIFVMFLTKMVSKCWSCHHFQSFKENQIIFFTFIQGAILISILHSKEQILLYQQLYKKECSDSLKECFLDFSGVFWWQLNYSNLFPESSLLGKNQWLLVLGYKKCRNFSKSKEKFFPQTWKNFFLRLGKILYSKTRRH